MKISFIQFSIFLSLFPTRTRNADKSSFLNLFSSRFLHFVNTRNPVFKEARRENAAFYTTTNTTLPSQRNDIAGCKNAISHPVVGLQPFLQRRRKLVREFFPTLFPDLGLESVQNFAKHVL